MLASAKPSDEFVAWCLKDRPGRNHPVSSEQLGSELLQEMRALVPKEGNDFHRIILVRMNPAGPPNERIVSEHDHPEHVVLYYLLPTGPLTIEGEVYQPQVGEMLYVPPRVKHAVPEVDELRISIALMVEV